MFSLSTYDGCEERARLDGGENHLVGLGTGAPLDDGADAGRGPAGYSAVAAARLATAHAVQSVPTAVLPVHVVGRRLRGAAGHVTGGGLAARVGTGRHVRNLAAVGKKESVKS